MAGKTVVWSFEAEADFQSIIQYIGSSSPKAARATAAKLLDTAASLSDFPYLGMELPETHTPAIRERHVLSYRLIYKIENGTITVLAVVHTSRAPAAIADRLK